MPSWKNLFTPWANQNQRVKQPKVVPNEMPFKGEQKASQAKSIISLQQLGQAQWSPRDYTSFATEGFSQNSICYRCVSMIAQAAASIPLRVKEEGEDYHEHPLLDLLQNPNPHQCGPEILEEWYGFLLVAGNTYLELVSINDTPRELYVLRPDRIKVVAGNQGWPQSFTYTVNNNSVEFPIPESGQQAPILHTKLFQPTNDETPWCAAFVGVMLERSNLISTKSLMARSHLDWGQECEKSKLGAIAIFKRGKSKIFGHVGFVMDETDSHIQLLSGNQNNKVSIAAYNKDNLLGLRWPTEQTQKREGNNGAKENDQKNSAFDIALEHVLKVEGSWSNHKEDRGGPTYKGITLNTFQKAVREGLIESGSTNELKALKHLTKAEIEKIYEQLYWQQADCQYFYRDSPL